jgi:hypothetical protein
VAAFLARQDLVTLIRGLEEAFGFFGGVPSELLFDQMRAVITRDLRMLGGQLVHNLEFLRFSRHWDVVARACRPYRAQTKGKVERPIRSHQRHPPGFGTQATLRALIQANTQDSSVQFSSGTFEQDSTGIDNTEVF